MKITHITYCYDCNQVFTGILDKCLECKGGSLLHYELTSLIKENLKNEWLIEQLRDYDDVIIDAFDDVYEREK